MDEEDTFKRLRRTPFRTLITELDIHDISRSTSILYRPNIVSVIRAAGWNIEDFLFAFYTEDGMGMIKRELFVNAWMQYYKRSGML